MRSLVDDVGQALLAVREKRPRVHCLTNQVAAQFTANVLLAFGAIPSMTISPEEVGLFVESADALLVNLGTFDRERQESVAIAIDVARETGKPWVLDPVFAERSGERARLARQLADLRPAIIRLNGAEYRALFDEAEEEDLVKARAAGLGLTLGVSAEEDVISDGVRLARCGNGHALLARVTAVGCAQSALMAALAAVGREEIIAAAGGFLIMGIAGEMAALRSQQTGSLGPGSFAVHLMDAIDAIDTSIIKAKARLR